MAPVLMTNIRFKENYNRFQIKAAILKLLADRFQNYVIRRYSGEQEPSSRYFETNVVFVRKIKEPEEYESPRTWNMHLSRRIIV